MPGAHVPYTQARGVRMQVPQVSRHASQVVPPRHAPEQVPMAQVVQVPGMVQGVVR